MSAPRVISQRLRVDFEYPVVFLRGVFRPESAALRDALARREPARRHRVAIYLDAGLVRARPGLPEEAAAYCRAHDGRLDLAGEPVTVPGGEAAKRDEAVAREVIGRLLALRMDRQSHVVVAGGGAVLDAVGFGAALVHRGLRVTRLPSTVLAQDDAGVGVKNAVNGPGGKNLLGAFAPPFAVINDLDFLRTLDARGWTDGIAEAFKVAMIRDEPFFRWLAEHAGRLAARDEEAMETLVVRCAGLHLDHIRGSGDPFELGGARPLDFGHWSAHKLELLTGHALSHGGAVAIGLALDAAYAVGHGWLDAADFAALCDGLCASGFTLWHDALDRRDDAGRRLVLGGIEDFREHLGGELCVTMPRGVGRRFEVHDLDPAAVEAAIETLRRRAGGAD